MSYSLEPGTTPLLMSLPHVGTRIPGDQGSRYVERVDGVEDTDWHLDRLYGFVQEMGVGVLVPNHSRYIIDLNRPPDNQPMYPGANNTELCPTHFFNGDALYRKGQEPDAAEVARRREKYWQPYHNAVAAELSRLKSLHGFAVLFDGHSIRSRIPWLFEGKLPDLNLGTADGVSCAGTLRAAVAECFENQTEFTHVVDGRFKGGYITRHYGRPAEKVHAVQLEMCQSLYMNEKPPFDYDADLAAEVQPVLASIIETMLAWRPDGL